MKTLKYSLFLLISVLFVTASFAQTLLKEQTVQTNFGKNLKVSVPAGDVKITTWSKEEVYVKITGNDEAINKYDFTIKKDKEDIIYFNPMFGEGYKENPYGTTSSW